MIEATFGSRERQAQGLPTYFESPLKILTANRHDKVHPLLKAAEAEALAGNWVALMLTYEAAPAFDRAMKTRPASGLPLAWAAVFAAPSQTTPALVAIEYEAGPWRPLVSRREFSNAISQIRELIAAGDTYQVNFTFPLVAEFKGNARSWFRNLCRAQGAEYCAYFDLGRYKVLSVSPELFFELEGRKVTTRPMKGTIGRGRWLAEDVQMAERLADSAKDRAENVMIVDLLRNDIGRVATAGSVNVKRLFDLERYETLWQMTSTIEATLRPEVDFAELMASLFPCGSITGAPKIRTMEIIRDLEALPRGAYTGTLGFLQPGGAAVFNVAIRTITIDSDEGIATFGVGGGITYDSTAEREYEECLVKSSFLNSKPVEFELLESLLLEDGRFFLLERHLQRMKDSGTYFGFCFPEGEVRSKLDQIAAGHAEGCWKIRLLLSRSGAVSVEAQGRENLSQRVRVALAAKPVSARDRFLFHKTTNRSVYNDAIASRPDCDDVILWNEAGEVTESTLANVVISLAGRCYTPPRQSGLLAGTMREELLTAGKISERVIRRADLSEADEIFLINSVSRWRQALLVP